MYLKFRGKSIPRGAKTALHHRAMLQDARRTATSPVPTAGHRPIPGPALFIPHHHHLPERQSAVPPLPNNLLNDSDGQSPRK
uniref:Uncharacterized protein n=1 Tax=Mycena chlorophos TaxID=658473 RepID=A0ABQ0KWR0_MYCCL|nr:predicted protein [Mycena chlorophos]